MTIYVCALVGILALVAGFVWNERRPLQVRLTPVLRVVRTEKVPDFVRLEAVTKGGGMLRPKQYQFFVDRGHILHDGVCQSHALLSTKGLGRGNYRLKVRVTQGEQTIESNGLFRIHK